MHLLILIDSPPLILTIYRGLMLYFRAFSKVVCYKLLHTVQQLLLFSLSIAQPVFQFISSFQVAHIVSICLTNSSRSNVNLFFIFWFATFISTASTRLLIWRPKLSPHQLEANLETLILGCINVVMVYRTFSWGSIYYHKLRARRPEITTRPHIDSVKQGVPKSPLGQPRTLFGRFSKRAMSLHFDN